MKKIRIIYMGSPEIAVPTLKALAEVYEVAGVVTQPDRQAGRGKKVVMPAVKCAALELGIPLIQPEKMKDPGVYEQLAEWNADLFAVMAFGKILRPRFLDLPPLGCLNVHASLLPRWRGASPIQAAILNGDKKTGVTVMKMDPGMDTGPMLAARETDILSNENTAQLSKRLGEMGANLLMETLPKYLDGSLTPRPQPEEGITTCGLINKQDGLLDLSAPCESLINKIHAFDPWPSAFFEWNEGAVKIFQAHIAEKPSGVPLGTHLIMNGLPAVAASDGLLVLDELQAPGKKAMSGKAFLSGCRTWEEN